MSNSFSGSQVLSTTKNAVQASAKKNVHMGKDDLISNAYGCVNNFSLYGRLIQGMKLTTEDTDAPRQLISDEIFGGILHMPALAAGRAVTLPACDDFYTYIAARQHNIPEIANPDGSAAASTLFPVCTFSLVNSDDASDLTLTANATDGTFGILGAAVVAAGTSGLFAICLSKTPTTAAGDDGQALAVRIA